MSKQRYHEINEYFSVNSAPSVPSAVQTISNSTPSAMLCPHQLHAEPVGSKRYHEINEYFSVNSAPSVPSAVQTISNSTLSTMVRISIPPTVCLSQLLDEPDGEHKGYHGAHPR